MKKVLPIILVLILAVVLIFVLKPKDNNNTSISDKENTNSVNISDIYTKISESVTLPEFIEPSETDLELFYDITVSENDEYIYKTAEVSPNVDTIAIFKLSDSSKIDELKGNLEEVKNTQMSTMKDYSPENYEIASNGVVASKGNYVYFVMSSNVKEIVNIIENNI